MKGMAGQRLHNSEIYDAIFDDAAFAALPARLAEALGGRSAVVGWVYADGSRAMLHHSEHWSDAIVAEYLQDFGPTDPWTVASVRHFRPNRALDLTSLVSPQEFERSILYNDLFRRIGDDTFWCASVPAASRLGMGTVSLHRGKRQGGFDAEMIQKLDHHARDLARMLRLRAHLASQKQKTDGLEQVLDYQVQAAIVVDHQRRLLHVNAAAEELLRDSRAFRAHAGRLESCNGEASQIRAAIAKACDPRSPGASAIAIEGHPGRLIVTVVPVQTGPGVRAALLLIQDMQPHDSSLSVRLQRLFGLTPAEAAVAQQLGEGLSLAEIAEVRGVAVETVRWQLKALAAKLGCSKQHEIAGLVRSIIPIRLNPELLR
jgi:DNA-binding CsgD family transcriptional regulator